MAWFEKKYSASSDMQASVHTVWDVLVNQEDYHRWNPFTPYIETDWKIGSKVMLTVKMKPGRKPIVQKEYVTKFDPPHVLAWGMKWGMVLQAERVQVLTETPGGKTSYVTEDVLTGLLTPLVHLMFGKYIQQGFEQIALALKNYTESK